MTTREVVEATMRTLADMELIILGEPAVMEGYGDAWNVAGHEVKTDVLVARVEERLR